MTERRRRQSIRLRDYDYASPGAYFVTICAYQRQPLFQDPPLRQIIQQTWLDQPRRFPNLALDAFVIMPNHLHFVIWLGHVGATLAVAPDRAGASPAPTLGDVIRCFKSSVAVDWLRHPKANGLERSGRIWQRNYYERVVRGEKELQRAREYIALNPLEWLLDSENPDRTADPAYSHEWAWLEGEPVTP